MKEVFVFRMKRSFIAIVIMSMFVCLLAGCDSPKKEAEQTAAKMADYLKVFDERAGYGIYDVNGDGRYEMLCAASDSHADGVYIIVQDPKTNELVNVGEFGSFGGMYYYPSEGYIISGFTGQGEDTTIVYKINDDSVSVEANLWDNTGTVGKVYEYRVNDAKVTKEEYYDVYKKYTSGEEVSVGFSDLLKVEDYETNYENILDALR